MRDAEMKTSEMWDRVAESILREQCLKCEINTCENDII